MEKPLGTFKTESFAKCGEIAEREGCGMILYDRRDNKGIKWCTPAKVDSRKVRFTSLKQAFYPQIACIQPDHQIRLKRRGYGHVACPGDVFVYMFKEIPLCESVSIINDFFFNFLF